MFSLNMFRGLISKYMLVLAVCLLAGCEGELRPTHSDAKEAFDELVQVQQAHQESIAVLALEKAGQNEQAPLIEDIVKKDTALALQNWRLRQVQFEYLIDNEPDRLRLRRGREGLVSFTWTAADSSELALENSEYLVLLEEIEALEAWLQEHRSDDVQQFFADLENTVEMKALHRAYARDEQAIVLRYRLAAILKAE